MRREIDSIVECNSSYSSCDYPKVIQWEGKRRSVKTIISEWRTPIEKHYQLLVAENLFLEVVFNEIQNNWKVEMI